MTSPNRSVDQADGPSPDKANVRLPVSRRAASSRPVIRNDGSSTPKYHLQQELLSAVSSSQIDRLGEQELRVRLVRLAQDLSRQHADLWGFSDLDAVVELVLDEVYGYGPLESLLRDDEISDILINGPRQLFIEKRGQLHTSEVTFRDEAHLMQVVRRMVASTGRRIDEKLPLVDARLPDGSRVNAVLNPPALNGPLVSIRRFGARPLTVEDLLANESIAKEMLDFLSACVQSRISMIISGGTGSGKTTLLNALSRFIPHSERVVTIEDTAELELQQPHVAKMEAQQPDLRGEGAVTMRDLVKNALRMRPDRIIVGECRGPEALEMLQAMNTGHEGSLTTIHANSTREALTRVELMIALAGVDIPVWSVRKLVGSSVHLVLQVARLLGGRRKIIRISEITGMESDTISMHDLFEFVQTKVDSDRCAEGYFRATGIRPKCLSKLNASGAKLGPELFAERVLSTPKDSEPDR